MQHEFEEAELFKILLEFSRMSKETNIFEKFSIKKHYFPEQCVFGSLLTDKNYPDDIDKVTENPNFNIIPDEIISFSQFNTSDFL